MGEAGGRNSPSATASSPVGPRSPKLPVARFATFRVSQASPLSAQVLERLQGCAPTDPEHVRAREYLRCLLSLPRAARSEAPVGLARARTVLDGGHAAHGAVIQRLHDYIVVRLAKQDGPSPLLTLVDPPGVGRLARLVPTALWRACAWVACGGGGSEGAARRALRSAPTDRRGVAVRRRAQPRVRP